MATASDVEWTGIVHKVTPKGIVLTSLGNLRSMFTVPWENVKKCDDGVQTGSTVRVTKSGTGRTMIHLAGG